MNLTLEQMPNLKIIYQRRIGTYGEANRSLMEGFKRLLKQDNLLDTDSVLLGIAQDDPRKTKSENCRYDVCLIVEKNCYVSNANYLTGTIEGGSYLVIGIDHAPEAMQYTYENIINFAQQEHQLIDDTKPIIERYDARKVAQHQCEICVPTMPIQLSR